METDHDRMPRGDFTQKSFPHPEYEAKARADMFKLANQTIPFGKYQGRRIIDLPEDYLLWFKQKGFPKGELGRIMQLALEIKVNGLEKLIPDRTDQSPQS